MGSHVETYLPKLPKPKVKLLRVPTGGLEVKLAEEKKHGKPPQGRAPFTDR